MGWVVVLGASSNRAEALNAPFPLRSRSGIFGSGLARWFHRAPRCETRGAGQGDAACRGRELEELLRDWQERRIAPIIDHGSPRRGIQHIQ
jgi:hypothetical protein